MTTAPGPSENAHKSASASRADDLLSRGAVCAAEIAARNDLTRAIDAGMFDAAIAACNTLRIAVRTRRDEALGAGFRTLLDAPMDSLDSPGLYLAQPPIVGIDGQRLAELAIASGTCVWVMTREPRTRRDLWPIVGVATQARRAQVHPAYDEREQRSGDLSEDAWRSWFETASAALGGVFIDAVAGIEHPAWRAADLLEAIRAAPESVEVLDAMRGACEQAASAGPAPARPRVGDESDDPYSF